MISIHIPSGGNAPDMNKEKMSAKNIKDNKVRKQTITGLNKISHYL